MEQIPFRNIATEFAKFYYEAFDSNRAELQRIYTDDSLMNFEGTEAKGVAQILETFNSFTFQKVKHTTSTVDAQLVGGPSGGIIVLVTGILMIDDDNNPKGYSQIFHLIRSPEQGTYYVLNDLFRLIL